MEWWPRAGRRTPDRPIACWVEGINNLQAKPGLETHRTEKFDTSERRPIPDSDTGEMTLVIEFLVFRDYCTMPMELFFGPKWRIFVSFFRTNQGFGRFTCLMSPLIASNVVHLKKQ